MLGSKCRGLGLMVLVLTVGLLTGCAYNVGYNSTYLPATEAHSRSDAKVLIYMPAADADWAFTGHPTSFTGGGTTLSIPLGNITQQIAVRAFSQNFTTVHTDNTLKDQADYTVIVQPRVQHFEYAYDQLKNAGFAITPEVWVDLHVKALDAQGKALLDKVYKSGKIEGETYMASASPAEKINAAVHKTLWKLMNDAIADIRVAMH